MPLDTLSFVAPARLRALVCPLGRIRRSRFAAFQDRLNAHYVVRLGDVTPDLKKPLFSPHGFPDGQVVYDFASSVDREHEYLETFEMHRRTFAVIGVADYTEDNDPEQLSKQFEELKFLYPRAVYHVCLLFDAPPDALEKEDAPKPKNVHTDYPSFIPVSPESEDRISPMRTVICDITAAVLSGMHTLAKSLQEMPTLDSPSQSSSRPSSREHRMSMPVGNMETSASLAKKRTGILGSGGGSAASVKERGKGLTRINIAIAQLHMISGRIPDALKEFNEAAESCKMNDDYLWHGKALEGIAICMVLLAHLQTHFQVPAIPFPFAEGASKSSKNSTPLPPAVIAPSVSSDGPSPATQVLSLLNDVNINVIHLYLRAAPIPGEKIPHISYCECIIRHSKALTAHHLSGGNHSAAITHMVTGTGLPKKYTPDPFGPNKVSINDSVMRAYPYNVESFTVLEATKVLSGIASVLGAIGMKRRKGMVTRELLKILIPGLIQARVVGAAEVGVHPAAGLSQLSAGANGSPLDLGEGDIESGITELLEDLCRAYGVLPGLPPPDAEFNAMGSDVPAVTRAVIAEQEIRSFGWPALKIHVLRNCASLCEALPDFEGVLKFTTQLLRMADMELTKEEQVRLSTTISRTVAAARKLGLTNVEAEYWDQFLLRDVELVENSTWRSPAPHTGDELLDVELEDPTEAPSSSGVHPTFEMKEPFIYNPSRKAAITTANLLLVAGETAEFKVTLQNPFEFEVEVESISLDTTPDSVPITCHPTGCIIGPFRTCHVSISATPSETGSITITGGRIKVYGCKERSFPIFTSGLDSRDRDTKTKRFGLSAAIPPSARPISTLSTNSANRLSARPPPPLHPIPKSLSVSVVPPQPLLTVKNTSLSQSALMILEGERLNFNITLQNLSAIDVDLLVFTFTDSITTRLQSLLADKIATSSPALERYELELLLQRKPAFVWKRPRRDRAFTNSRSGRRIFVPAHGEATFTLQALGKPGLQNGVITAEYSHLGVARSELIDNKFFTRRLEYPITVTVNASTELKSIDILPFSSAAATISAETRAGAWGPFKKLFESRTGDYCLLVLDLRNSWPHPLRVEMAVDNTEPGKEREKEIDTTSTTIHPGSSSRILLPLRRVHLSNPLAPIPSLTAHTRQFVVSAARISVSEERESREAFWFRENLLSRLSGTWEEEERVGGEGYGGRKRRGEVGLRSFTLTKKMVDTFRIEDVSLDLSLAPATTTSSANSSGSDTSEDEEEEGEADGVGEFRELTPTHVLTPPLKFLTLTLTLTSRLPRTASFLLRIIPSLANQPIVTALELGKRLAINGVQQFVIRDVVPGEVRIWRTGVVGLVAGVYEVGIGGEEIRGGVVGGEGDGKGGEDDGIGGEWAVLGGDGEREREGRELVMEGLDEGGRVRDVLEGRGGRWWGVGRERVRVEVV